jgi:hypothetical protein
VRFADAAVVPNRANVDRSLLSNRLVQGTTSRIASLEKPLSYGGSSRSRIGCYIEKGVLACMKEETERGGKRGG